MATYASNCAAYAAVISDNEIGIADIAAVVHRCHDTCPDATKKATWQTHMDNINAALAFADSETGSTTGEMLTNTGAPNKS